MASWDLPILMRPELTLPSLYQLSDLGEAGVTIFLPWYLLRDKDLTVRDIASLRRIREIPQGVEPWVRRRSQELGPRSIQQNV